MAQAKNICTPLTDEVLSELKCGDMVNISGIIYTGRDAAHKIMVEMIDAGEQLPVDWDRQVIYYAGPTPAKPGRVIGSCGPTTSGRMDKYSPAMMEQGLKGMIGKGPRDLVARSIETEIKEGRGFGQGMGSYVLMDLRHLGAERIMERLPQVRELAMAFEGVDMITDPVPIRPSNHYMMGGIDVVDFRTCATVVDGLHAAGECSCISVHGANRLGGNSVSEVVFFGKQAGIGAAETARRRDFAGTDRLEELERQWDERFRAVRAKRTGEPMFAIRDRMAEAMWNGVGIFRTEEGMAAAEAVVDECMAAYADARIDDDSQVYNQAFMNYVELGNVLSIAKTVCMGARARTESRGSHSREDYPVRDDERFLAHTLVSLSSDGAFTLGYRPVRVTRFAPEERKY